MALPADELGGCGEADVLGAGGVDGGKRGDVVEKEGEREEGEEMHFAAAGLWLVVEGMEEEEGSG